MPADNREHPRFARCMVYVPRKARGEMSRQIAHLVQWVGRGTPGDTLCGLSRFDKDGRKADLPGWGMEGGVSGPSVEQIDCTACYRRADALLHSRDGLGAGGSTSL